MIEIFSGTTIGKREQQQDCFLVDHTISYVMPDHGFTFQVKHDEGPLLIGLFDGLGGEMFGNIASARAAELLYSEFSKWYDEKKETNFEEFLRNATDAAHETITQEFDSAGVKGGTTLTAAVIFRDELYFINVGDSPAFLCRGKDSIEEISLRQNCAGYLKSIGRPYSKRDESILLHCIGNDTIKTGISRIAHTITLPFRKGDCLILCSDGITNTVKERELLNSSNKRDMIKTGRKLVKKAGDAPNSDNSTIIIVRKK